MTQNKFKTFFQKNELNIILYLILFILLSSFLLSFYFYNSKHSIYNDEYVYLINTVIINENGIEKTHRIKDPIDIDGIVEYKIDLSEYMDLEKISLETRFAYCNAEVYADGKLIYELKKPENAIVKSGGYKTVIIDLPDNLKSPYINIKIEPLLSSMKTYKIRDISIGKKSDIILVKLKEEVITIILCIILIFTFIVILIINLRNKDFTKSENYSLLLLSLYGLLLAVYFLTQLWSTGYFLSGFSESIYFHEFISLSLVFVPATMYIKHKVDKKFTLIFDALIFILIFNATMQFILTLAGVKEFKEMLIHSLGLITITMLFIIISIILSDGEKYPFKKKMLVPVILIIISTLFVLVYYLLYKVLIFKTYAFIISISIIVIGYKELYERYVYYKKEEIEKNIYKELASKDSLTGLCNRQAHEEFIIKVQDDKISGWIISIDINNLKYINDTFGHLSGDNLIKCFANILKQIQKENPKINAFRIGGDEFFIFFEENENYDISKLVAKLKEEYSQGNCFDYGFIQSFSAGYYYYDSSVSTSVMDVYNKADKMMYSDKAFYKKEFRKFLKNKG